MFENVVLREKLRLKGEEVALVLRILHYLYLMLCIIALVVSRIMKCVVQMLKMLFAYEILIWKKTVRSANLGGLDVGGRIVLKFMLKE